jgi:hypothetical protein
MSANPLPLSILCDVTVEVESAGVSVPSFNQPLIVGNSGVIPSQGANSRLRQYAVSAFPANIVADGFTPTDQEYIAASLICSATVPPQYFWIGCQDPTAIAAVTVDVGGTGYLVGDIVVVAQGGASGGTLRVATVADGVVTAVTLGSNQGTAYSVASALATTGGTGTGLEVNITAIGETPLEAVTACRNAQPSWYTAMVCGATDSDHEAIAAYAQTVTPQMQYLGGTQSIGVLTGATGNVLSVLKAANYSRSHIAYSTTQGGAAPNNAYIAAAVSGLAMGLNTGLANSNFTLAAKTLPGITVEPLSLSQVAIIAGLPGQSTGNNGNVYLNYANSYSFYGQGVNSNGTWFDQILALDMLAADCQISVLNALAANVSIPQTNAGQMIILSAVTGACVRAATRGSIAGGIWNGPSVLNLVPGASLPNGYLVQSPAYSTQSSGTRALRASVPVYVTVILAGSQQSFTIGIYVQQ